MKQTLEVPIKKAARSVVFVGLGTFAYLFFCVLFIFFEHILGILSMFIALGFIAVNSILIYIYSWQIWRMK